MFNKKPDTGGQTQQMNDGGGDSDQEIEFADFTGAMADIHAKTSKAQTDARAAIREEQRLRRVRDSYRRCVC